MTIGIMFIIAIHILIYKLFKIAFFLCILLIHKELYLNSLDFKILLSLILIPTRTILFILIVRYLLLIKNRLIFFKI